MASTGQGLTGPTMLVKNLSLPVAFFKLSFIFAIQTSSCGVAIFKHNIVNRFLKKATFHKEVFIWFFGVIQGATRNGQCPVLSYYPCCPLLP